MQKSSGWFDVNRVSVREIKRGDKFLFLQCNEIWFQIFCRPVVLVGIERRDQGGYRIYVFAGNFGGLVLCEITDEAFGLFVNKHKINSFIQEYITKQR